MRTRPTSQISILFRAHSFPSTAALKPRVFVKGILLALIVALPSATAFAQDPEPLPTEITSERRNLSQGVDRSDHNYSGDGDASSIELNPALLGPNRGLDLVFRGYDTAHPYARGSGYGFFASGNLGGFLTTGFGVQRISPGFRGGVYDSNESQNLSVTKVSGALAANFDGHAAIGVGIHGLRQQGHWLRGADFDIGLLIRATNYASVGFATRLSPLWPQDQNVGEVRTTSELTIRPLATDRIELATGLHTWHNRFEGGDTGKTTSVLPFGRVGLRYHGFSLHGEIERMRGTLLDPNTQDATFDTHYLRGSVTVGVQTGAIAAAIGFHTGLSSNNIDGISGMARFHTAQLGSTHYTRRRVDVQRLDLGKIDGERSLIRFLEKIQAAEAAGKRSIVLVEVSNIKTGWASATELRQALIHARNAGAHIIAYVQRPSIKSYYVASAAEHLWMHPAGELSMPGLSTTAIYYKDVLNKLGVKAEVLHTGEYKSAHESVSRNERSEADREQRTQILDSIYEHVVYNVAKGRQLTQADVRRAIDETPQGPKQAMELGFVDKLVYRDELLDSIEDVVGVAVDFHKFDDTTPDQTWGEAPFIGVVLVDGTIVSGKSVNVPIFNVNNSGSHTIVETIQDLRSNRACEGIVVRINSPGGSAFASDEIWREIAQTQKAFHDDPKINPPLVVSMSDVAASGGYYIAMGADKVFAQDTTITGSIGVVSMHFDASQFLDGVGVRTDTIRRGRNAGMFEPYQPFSDEQRKQLNVAMSRTYDRFIGHVAQGRNLEESAVRGLAKGRVYPGDHARKHRLVDETGGLREAVELLRKQSDVADRIELNLEVFPKQQSLLDVIFGSSRPLFLSVLAKGISKGQAQEQGFETTTQLLRSTLFRLPFELLFLPTNEASLIVDHTIEIR